MAAVVATDDESPPVEYYFDCISGLPDSGWITESTYMTGPFPAPNHTAYRVKTRNAAGIESGWSTIWHTYDGPVAVNNLFLSLYDGQSVFWTDAVFFYMPIDNNAAAR